MYSAAFFDRDGTINVNFGHVYRPKDLVFVEGIPETIKLYNNLHVPVIVVTNQAGIAKGYYSKQDMLTFHAYMRSRLLEDYGAHIDRFYFCPHHPEYTGECDCRKPKPGMFIKAANEFGILLSESIMYGDKEGDRIAAQAAGIRHFVLIDDNWQSGRI